MASPEERLAELGITLPTPIAPVANYVPLARTGNLLIVSGQLPMVNNQLFAIGRLGEEVDVETGKKAAYYCMINIIAQVKAELGDLSKVKKLVRLGGFVSGTPNFTQQATIINGASDLAVEVFGDAGHHSRAAVGVASLPLGACVEVEAMFEVE